MCGICGFLGLSDDQLLKSMCQVMEHRGPDDEGYYTGDTVGLGNRRLSIIDLEGGRQPIHNEDESVWVVQNGEIYNYRELSRILESRGHRFYTKSDTEVIVHAYEEYGLDFPKKLNGMFSIAVWDQVSKRLVLARDPIGVKPLYYTLHDGVLYFASEIKAILENKSIPRRVDEKSLNILINIRYLPYEHTMFAGIKKLLPGHILIAQDGQIRQQEYWDVKPQESADTEQKLAKTLRKKLEEAVKRQMVSDVPLGAFLSGGLDTSSIVALMSKYSDEPIQTFCMGFGEDEDENNDAHIIAEQYGTVHSDLVIDSSRDLKLLPLAVWHVDMPKINLYPYHIAELAGRNVKVCLSGAGGDELFGGYVPRFSYIQDAQRLADTVPRFVRILPQKLAALAAGLQARYGPLSLNSFRNYLRAFANLDDRAGFYYSFRSLHEKELEKLYKTQPASTDVRQIVEPYFKDGDFLNQVLLAETKTVLVDDYLIVDDAMSMAHSLEVRVPLLDKEFVEYAFTIPSSMKVRQGSGKHIFKQAVSDLLPQNIINKPKQGFGMDVGTWFRGELREVASQVLDESEALKKYFKLDYPKDILSHPYTPSLNRGYYLLWTLVSFDLWHRIYIQGDAKKPGNKFRI